MVKHVKVHVQEVTREGWMKHVPNGREESETARDWDPRTHEKQPGIGTREPMRKLPGIGTREPMRKQPGSGTPGPMNKEHSQQQADEYL